VVAPFRLLFSEARRSASAAPLAREEMLAAIPMMSDAKKAMEGRAEVSTKRGHRRTPSAPPNLSGTSTRTSTRMPAVEVLPEDDGWQTVAAGKEPKKLTKAVIPEEAKAVSESLAPEESWLPPAPLATSEVPAKARPRHMRRSSAPADYGVSEEVETIEQPTGVGSTVVLDGASAPQPAFSAVRARSMFLDFFKTPNRKADVKLAKNKGAALPTMPFLDESFDVTDSP